MDTHTQPLAKHWYDRSYKWALVVPALLLAFSLFSLYHQYQTTGDFIHKDVSLTGGVSISIFDSSLSLADITDVMDAQFPGSTVRAIADVRTGEQKGITVESQGEQAAVQAALDQCDHALGAVLHLCRDHGRPTPESVGTICRSARPSPEFRDAKDRDAGRYLPRVPRIIQETSEMSLYSEPI